MKTKLSAWFVLMAVAHGAHAGDCRTKFAQMLEVTSDPRDVYNVCAAEAKGGDVQALFFSSLFFFGLEGFEKDAKKGLAIAQAAADQGSPDAQYWMGLVCESGDLLPRDPAQALQWYERAADSGHAFASERLAQAYRSGELGLPVDEEKAKRYAMQQEGQSK